MPMIKRGDGSTGEIVEAAKSDGSGVCVDCGRIFPECELDDGHCGCTETANGAEISACDCDEECDG